MQSYNILVIKNISVIPEYNQHTAKVKAELNAEIKFYCSVTKNHFRSLIIESEGKAYSDTDALRQCIQNLIDSKFYSQIIHYNREVKSRLSNKVHSIDIQVSEPFKSLFEQLFDVSSWEIEKTELPI